MITSRTINWLNEVRKADPSWDELRLRPLVYFFSNGRVFRDKPDPYSEE